MFGLSRSNHGVGSFMPRKRVFWTQQNLRCVGEFRGLHWEVPFARRVHRWLAIFPNTRRRRTQKEGARALGLFLLRLTTVAVFSLFRFFWNLEERALTQEHQDGPNKTSPDITSNSSQFGHVVWFWHMERENTFTTAVTGSAEGGQHEAPRDLRREVRRLEAPGCGALRCQGV